MRKTIEIEDTEIARALLGEGDCHLRRVREALGVEVVVRRDNLHLTGAEGSVDKGVRTFQSMLRIVREGRPLATGDVEKILSTVQGREDVLAGAPHRKPAKHGWDEDARETRDAREAPDDLLAGRVRALSEGQRRYLDAISRHDVVFAIGPAGTGKTYLAVAMAVECLASRMVNRLVLVRPAVEAGEHLGFLPGDLREKVNPYLRPLYDALHDLVNPNQVARFMERGVIEVAPLAFMRGRTLNSAFVILDEAQNTTPKQMKMFLTRLGRDSRAVITGDVTQVDLPDGDLSGLAHARSVLAGVDGVAFMHLERVDIVRHPLVQRIVDAYEERENAENGAAAAEPGGTG